MNEFTDTTFSINPIKITKVCKIRHMQRILIQFNIIFHIKYDEHDSTFLRGPEWVLVENNLRKTFWWTGCVLVSPGTESRIEEATLDICGRLLRSVELCRERLLPQHVVQTVLYKREGFQARTGRDNDERFRKWLWGQAERPACSSWRALRTA